MSTTFNAQSPSPIVMQPAPVAELHPTIAGICRSFNENLAQATRPTDPAPTILQCPVTVGTNVRRPDHIEYRDISYVMTAIKEGRYESIDLQTRINNIRTAPTDEGRRYAKSQLPWFCGSLIKDKRANDNVISARYMIYDLDHVKDIEAIKQKAVRLFPWVRYAFRSVTDGVKLIGMLSKPLADEEKFRTIYSYLSLQLETLLKVPCDHTPDWARACFISYDPEMISNRIGLKPIDAEDYYRQALNIRDLLKNYPHDESPVQKSQKTTKVVFYTHDIEDDYAKAEKVISALSQQYIERADWIKIGFALYAGFGERGKALWDMFVDNPKYNDTQRIIDMHWNSFRNVRSITLSSLFYLAGKYGVDNE